MKIFTFMVRVDFSIKHWYSLKCLVVFYIGSFNMAARYPQVYHWFTTGCVNQLTY